ncbi:helix-turn-helix transcriptional regulator [Marinobacterium zhoushanense]|uniref:Helix-turn-helix transcriptional regulator n=1 Tax=Marinobacterium zhoushanense TaxID=1679163 RepID=A0ABQ1K2T1_9GAMM|nr:helix-turn-helix transcriptional regulator [Marinobacterium zhoushanense]GGB84407.1 helix-turn-helix transcriptional regulator [Marinobacterium zhoushanense]
MNVNSLSHSVGLYQFQEECLGLLTGVLDVPKAISYLIDEKGKPVCYKVHQLQPSMHREYVNTYHKYDPLHPTLFSDNDVDVVKMSDLVSGSERSEHPYFQEFINPWGVRDIVELFLRQDNQLIAGFALFNLASQPEIDADYVRRVNKLYQFMQFSLEQSIGSPKNAQFDTFCSQHGLTNKERLVVELVTQGLPNKSIANNLDCSLATVKTHLQHIFQKLSINSKNELISTLYQKH